MKTWAKITLVIATLLVLAALAYIVAFRKTADDYIEMLKSDNPYDRSYAADMLGKYESPKAEVIEALKESLNDPFYEVRSYAVDSLAKIGDKSILPLIEQKAIDKNEHDWVRSYATQAFRTLGEKKHIPILKKLLADDNFGVRRQAIWALSSVAGSEAIPIFREELKKSEGSTSNIIRYGLFELGDKDHIPFVIDKLDSNKFDKKRSLKLLSNYIADTNFGSNSNEWLNWWEENKDNIIWDSENKKYRVAKGLP